MVDLPSEQFSRLVERAYEAGLDPSRWAAFVNELALTVDRAYVVLHGLDLVTGTSLGLISATYEPEQLRIYGQHYAAKNPWAAAKGYAMVGSALRSEQMVPREVLTRSEFYNDWLRPQEDIGTGGGITLFRAGGRLLRLSANIRMRDADRRQAQLVALLDGLAPHLRQAVTMTRRLWGATSSEEFERSFGHLPSGMVLVDRAGRVRQLNRAAERMAQQADLLRVAPDGALVLSDARAANRLARTINEIAARDYSRLPGPFALLGQFSGRSAEAVVVPYRSNSEAVSEDFIAFALEDLPVALISITESGGRATDPAVHLAGRYNLTRSEAALAIGLAAGRTLREFAEERRISVHTARNQLKSIFLKTNVGRQSALVALLADELPAERKP